MVNTGQVLNDTYEITERLGSGAGGIIFKAYHRRMRKNVAIKLVKDEIKGSLDNRSEVDVLKNLKNDFLPQVIDFVEDGNDVYTVMEFIEGQNFKQLITSGRRFDEKSVRKYALQLCEAVEYLHNHQPPIIHSDIKPANIMLTPQNKICLIDFNISMMTNTGMASAIGGSRGFAAPEQFKQIINAPSKVDEFHEETRFVDNDDTEILPDSVQTSSRHVSLMQTKNSARAFIDVRTDIYGIGVSIYYMLTSRIPAGGQLDFRGIHCSSVIKEVIEKAMNPDPSKRYKNVAELKRALQSKISVKMLTIPAAAVCGVALCVGIVSSGIIGRIAEMIEENRAARIAIETSVTSGATETVSLTEMTMETESSQSSVDKVLAETEVTTEPEFVAVPLLNGLTEDEAIKACVAAGLTYEVKSAENDTVEQGFVANQQIPADVTVPSGTKVTFTVSNGKTVRMATVPSVINKSYSDAIAALDEAGLQHEIVYEDDDRVQKGYVFKQSLKSGTSIEENSVITIYVSTHEEIITTTHPTETTTTTDERSWRETEISETLYIKTACYSRVGAVVGSDAVKKYEAGSKINVVAATDTGYYKLADGTFIHSDYVTDKAPAAQTVVPTTISDTSLYAHETDITMNVGESKYVIITTTDHAGLTVGTNNKRVATAGFVRPVEWDGDNIKIYIDAKGSGTTKIKVYLKNYSSKYYDYINVTVN